MSVRERCKSAGSPQVRVAFIITRSDTMGGASIHVRDLCVALRERDALPTVLVGGSGEFTRQLAERGIGFRSLRHLVRPVAPHHDLLAAREIAAALRELAPDVVSTHSSKAGLAGRVAARRVGVPALFTAHGWSFTDGVGPGSIVYRGIERHVAPLAARIITVSEYDRALALRHGIAAPARIVTIHNGMPDVAAEMRADPGRQPLRLVMVGRLERQKDHATLLTALGMVGSGPWELDLIGEGPLEPVLKAQAAALGIADRVHFLGARRDVPERLAMAQLFVLATNWEGFPRSILEAMRAGLPVVASRVAGIPESVSHDVTGLLVPRGDAAALRDALQGLIGAPARRVTLGEAGRAAYEREFTFEHMFSRTRSLYDEVVRERHG